MGNMCCKREMYAPNGTDTDQSRCNNQQQQNGNHQQHLLSKHQHPAVMSSAYHSAGDDCAINELLEGRMDLDVLLPDGRKVRLTVERRTPMMDLLVQAASATKISPGGHVIHVFGEGDKGRGALQYKPSTPIGTLDTKTICIVPKKESSDPLARKLGKTANRPFEPTFRVQVHLPRNQLTVLRVSPRIKISELKSMVCKEKGLDMNRYQLVRPSGPTQPLSGDMTLADYGSTEITLLSNSSIEAHICNSNSHIIPYSKRPEEPKRRTGILRLLTEDANNKVNETANCKSISQVDSYQRNKANKSEEANVHQNRYKPKKRRPAPPPPPPVLPEAPSHSRQSSSDSSGYHEATSSFLHEEHSGEEKASSDSSGVSSLGAKDPPLQPSPPLIPNSKKKKAPAPPPPPPPTVQKEKTTHRPAPKSPSSIQQGLVAPKVSAKEVTIIEAEDSGNKIKAELQEKTVHVENNSVTSDINAKDSVVLSQQTVEKKISCESNQESSKAPSMVKEFTISPYSTSKGNNKLKADFQVKTVDVENISVTSDVGAKDSVILLKQIVENKLSCESSQKSSNDPSLVKEFTISPYSTSKNNPIIQDNAAVLEDNLMKEDCLTQKNNNNNNIFRDQIPNTNHAIVKDQVLKQDAEGKLDLLRLRESEGQPLVTVAAKVLPTANVSADTIKDKQSSQVETSPVKEIRETSSFVPDVHRSRTPENKVEKERVPRKGEAVSTRVALVALNARIEQDVTQQEIASSIQAAFHSVDCSPQPSLLSIKQRSADDSNVQVTRDRSLGSFESIPPKTTTTVKVPLNLDTVNKSSVRSSPEITRKFGDLEREALLIDEEPLPRPASSGCAFTKNLRRSSSLLNFADTSHRNSSYANNKRSRHLQRSLSDLSTDEKEDFETEQERLHREYIKLQRQFILWQQQLMNNHAMLREECIVPQYARTLRQSHSLPEGEDSFEEVTPSVPLVSRSLSYEPTKDRCSTLPRSAINITSLELGSIPIGNGTSTLRSSKTKSYFKPPQVRISTKSRQRLPPEIKKEGDVDITDDTKMLTTILPSFESLKLITENNDEDSLSNGGVSRLKDMNPVTKHTPTEGRKVPVVHLSSTFPKMNTRLNNGDKTADSNLKYVNGDSGQSKPQTDCSKATVQQSQQKSQPPPPPPPVPTFGMSKSSVKESTKSTGQRNGVERRNVALEVDPREQLMLEIRKFGGRTALRKISLAS